jgi:hypothetical protein
MFHVSSARLARLARRIEARLAIPDEYAAWYGWEARQVRPGVTEYRDPRFTQLANARTVQAGHPPAARTWAQAEISDRIRRIGTDDDRRSVIGGDA